jgi:hypothetical protein
MMKVLRSLIFLLSRLSCEVQQIFKLEAIFCMQISEAEDRSRIQNLELERIADLLFQVRNLWRVDGLYFLGIEEKFGTNAATEIDANCWSSLAKIEARELKKIFGLEKVESVEKLLELLLNTSWALYQTKKEFEVKIEKKVWKSFRAKKSGSVILGASQKSSAAILKLFARFAHLTRSQENSGANGNSEKNRLEFLFQKTLCNATKDRELVSLSLICLYHSNDQEDEHQQVYYPYQWQENPDKSSDD